jgi:hypothetical protein
MAIQPNPIALYRAGSLSIRRRADPRKRTDRDDG